MTDQEKILVCCTLPAAELRTRISEIEATIGRHVAEVRELDNGYALRFRSTAGIVENLGRFIACERICCAFLDFSLQVAAGDGPIWLELTGSSEAKAFLQPAIAQWTS